MLMTVPPAQPAKPVQCHVPGMNEKLAYGLAKRYVQDWFELHLLAFDRARKNMPPVTKKRAAAYRSVCEWMSAAVPRSLVIFESPRSRYGGKDKNEMFTQICWDCTENKLFVMATVMFVPARNLDQMCTFSPLRISHHAMARVFQRLRTDRSEMVTGELNAGVLGAISYLRVLMTNLQEGDTAMVPTPSGAMVVCKDSRDPDADYLVVRTWISDERMQYDNHRQAVEEARAANSVVLRCAGQTWIADPSRAVRPT